MNIPRSKLTVYEQRILRASEHGVPSSSRNPRHNGASLSHRVTSMRYDTSGRRYHIHTCTECEQDFRCYSIAMCVYDAPLYWCDVCRGWPADSKEESPNL